MEFKLQEKEMYSLTRELVNIRSAIYTLESEMLYLPTKSYESYQNQLSKYQKRMENARLMCNNAINILNGSFPDKKLF